MTKKEKRSKIYELIKEETGTYPRNSFRKKLKEILKEAPKAAEEPRKKDSGWRMVKGAL